MSEIKFGTDGWRAVIAEDFTFENVRLLARAYCHFLKTRYQDTPGYPPPLVVGYDTRFQSDRFARAVAEVIAARGFDVYLATAASPTPAISWAVKNLQVAGGIIITSSHNPAIWNGFKIKADYAGSADAIITAAVEKALSAVRQGTDAAPEAGSARRGALIDYDPRPPYFEQLSRLVDIERIRRSDLMVVIDPLFGATQGYVPSLLGLPGDRLRELHGYRDAYFGGLNPEPIPPNTDELCHAVAAISHANRLGLGLDGDGDRLGVVDDRGHFLECQKVLALLLHYLVAVKGWTGEVVKTFSVGRQVEKVAEALGLTLHETPIGFKYICDLMRTRDILIGGEESGGVGIKGHIPERDGSLAGLLVLEMVAAAGKPLSAIIEEFDGRYGQFIFNRTDMHLEQAQSLVDSLAGDVPLTLMGITVREIATTDGLKLLLEDGSWLLLRGSGTEPVLRIYAEANGGDQVECLLEEGRRWATTRARDRIAAYR